MPVLLAAVLAALAAGVRARTLDSAYGDAVRALPARPAALSCWTRAPSAAADAAGMPKAVCLGPLKVSGGRLALSGYAALAGGAQREELTGERPLAIRGGRAWATVFRWEAGPGEFDEESVVQVSFRLDAAGAPAPGTERLVAFHQCPERGCSYACGLTAVEFVAAP